MANWADSNIRVVKLVELSSADLLDLPFYVQLSKTEMLFVNPELVTCSSDMAYEFEALIMHLIRDGVYVPEQVEYHIAVMFDYLYLSIADKVRTKQFTDRGLDLDTLGSIALSLGVVQLCPKQPSYIVFEHEDGEPRY